jgi:hypothetical protein
MVIDAATRLQNKTGAIGRLSSSIEAQGTAALNPNP